MPNYLDAHLESSMQTDADLNARAMYMHLATAVVIGVLPAVACYMTVKELGVYDTPLPCIPQLGDWLIKSGYASASYATVIALMLLCVSCAPGGQASTFQKMVCAHGSRRGAWAAHAQGSHAHGRHASE